METDGEPHRECRSLCQGKDVGINLSKVAEEALAEALMRRLAEQARADIDRDLEAFNAFVEAHGSFAEMVREHYATGESDASV
jgi:post-segregation antitoxin (ccd killing protein)